MGAGYSSSAVNFNKTAQTLRLIRSFFSVGYREACFARSGFSITIFNAPELAPGFLTWTARIFVTGVLPVSFFYAAPRKCEAQMRNGKLARSPVSNCSSAIIICAALK